MGERRELIAVELNGWLTSGVELSVNPLTGERYLCGWLQGDSGVLCCWTGCTGEGTEDS